MRSLPRLLGAVLSVALLCHAPSVDASSWRPVGPWGGYATQIVRCDAAPSVLYAISEYGGVHRSTDGGVTWSTANGDLPPVDYSVGLLTPDPSHGEAAWLSNGVDLWRTQDGGRHWAARPSPAALSRVLAVAPGTGDVVLAGGPGGLFRSDDGGATWRLLRHGLQSGYGVVAAAFDRFDARIAYASIRGPYYGIYVTRSGGASWQRVLARKLSTLRADPQQTGVVVAWDGLALLRSRDTGATWETLVNAPAGISAFAFTGGRPSDVVFATHDDLDDVVREIDGATGRVTPFAQPVARRDARALEVDARGEVIVGGLNGIVRTADRGATWTASERGFTGGGGGALAVQGRTAWIAGNWRTVDGGAHWTRFLPDQLVTDVAGDPAHPGRLYAATDRGTIDGTLDRVFTSQDGGATWVAAAQGLNVSTARALAVDARHPGTVYLGTEPATSSGDFYGGVFATTDYGASWHRVGAGVVIAAMSLALGATEPPCLFASTYQDLRRSCDGGATWTVALPDAFLADVAVSRVDPRRMYAVEGYTSDERPLRFWKSADGGTSWTEVALPIPAATTLFEARLAIDERHPQTVYLAGDVYGAAGVWRLGADDTWQNISDGLFNRDVRALRYDARSRPRLFASTFAGVFVRDLE